MGRAGGGGGGRAGGGHSGGGGMRSGGGHSSSGFNWSGGSSGRAKGSSFSSGRAGGGSSTGGFGMGSGKNSGGPGGSGSRRNNPGGPGGMGARQGMTPPPGGRRRRMFFGFTPFWRRGYGRGYYRGRGGGCLTFFIVIFFVVFLLVYSGMRQFRQNIDTDTVSSVTDISASSDDSSSGNSSEDHSSGEHSSDEADHSEAHSDSVREKVESDLTFDSNCILDELGWFDDASSAGESLEDFFDATGVQPYIYLRSYDSSLTSDSEKDDYAQQWYEDNIENEQTFLYIYFAEEDTDNDVGYMSCVCGYDIEKVMDEEARELFWDYVDEYWPTDLSTDEMFAEIFNSLADEIM